MKIFQFLFITLIVWGAFSEASFASCRDIKLKGSLDADLLWQDFSALASEKMQGRRTGTPGSALAREYIAAEFRKASLRAFDQEGTYALPFTYHKAFGDIAGVNVAGWYKGAQYPEQFIIVTAHYDHLGVKAGKIYYGADDNASGVAAMLAMARQVSLNGSQHSVLFLATDAEEKGLFGAKAFVDNPPVPLDKIRFNLNLDMMAQGGRKRALYVSGAKKGSGLATVVEDTIKRSGICLKKGHRAQRSGSAMPNRNSWRQASDHAPFARKDIPFLFVGVGLHKDYHTPDDRVDRIDKAFYTGAVETSLMLLRGIDLLGNVDKGQ